MKTHLFLPIAFQSSTSSAICQQYPCHGLAPCCCCRHCCHHFRDRRRLFECQALYCPIGQSSNLPSAGLRIIRSGQPDWDEFFTFSPFILSTTAIPLSLSLLFLLFSPHTYYLQPGLHNTLVDCISLPLCLQIFSMRPRVMVALH